MKSLHVLLSITLASIVILTIAPHIGLANNTDPAIASHILLQIRIPRVLLAFIIGAGLALCGLVFQAMFHNPLATPFTLGVASGASLGAALAVFFGLSFTFIGMDSTSFLAFIGALTTISFVYCISRFGGGFSTEVLLLTGIAVSFFFSSLILLTQYLSDITGSFRILRWLMGNLSIIGYNDIWRILPVVSVVTVLVFFFRRDLNLLAAGDDIAMSRGVSVKKLRYVLFFSTSICIGAIVALCGPIGFVGMMVPHICRLLIGNDHRWLIPASCLFGGAFLILCDGIGRLVIAPAEIPVGVITTLLGGPFFLWLLIRARTHRP
ncbi:MAG: FecCD family ABC transporter permease [Methylophagaceae bacterium]|jgi:iron complex transport system permease protein|tara:strand:- start:448 stop:1413 length:966 start_codon:yes stop_codon:yes gene_type:complete